MRVKHRDFHKLAIVRREAVAATRVVPSAKRYSRKCKHAKRHWGYAG